MNGLESVGSMLAGIPEITRYVTSGGHVVIPIEVLALMMWFFVVMRFFVLRRGTSPSIEELATLSLNPKMDAYLPGKGALSSAAGELRTFLAGGNRLDEYTLAGIFYDRVKALTRYRRGIAIIVVLAPLLGLLGTVSGMIETFEALTAAGGTSDGGIAGGISKALVTTQLGLSVAIPGVLAARLLERREQKLKAQLDRLRDAVARNTGLLTECSSK